MKENFKGDFMELRFDFNNMFEESLGKREGFSAATIKEDKALISKAFDRVISQRGKGWQEWTELPYNQDKVVEEILCYAQNDTIKSAKALVVFGIGGSALGPLTVAYSLLHMRHNELSKKARAGVPKYYIEDNVDPERMASLLDVIDVKKTVFNLVTKSGETSETLSQFLVVWKILKKKLGNAAAERIVVTTTDGKGTLYDIAKGLGCKVFSVGQGVGGRFSVLSPVGLLPFAILGLDIKEILRGAMEMSEASFNSEIFKNPALMSAYLQVKSMGRGRNISVMMPYADSLKFMADFYCQIWGESLGKAVDIDGKAVNCGQTPVKALGVTDQHSQVQLYTEGPYDKVVTVLAVENFRKAVNIPRISEFKNLNFLAGGMDNLINCERVATEFALTKAERANFTVTLQNITPSAIGALLSYFMYKTAFAGALLNVDTYNQPGVEEGKLATFAMLGRKGYEGKLKEIKAKAKKPEYIM
jgi:glucose-6-phosphate isomerase